MSLLAFSTPGLESAFVRRRNAQLLRNDAAWALFWLMFGGAGIGKAAMQPWGRQTWQEIAAICAYMAWSPLLLWLINRRTDFYLRHRSAVLVAMRIVRTTLLMQHMDQRQTLWVGAAGSPPTTVLMVYVHLCHKINFLLLTSVGVLLPMRLHLPLHLVFFLLMLRATAQRCRAECDVAHAAAGALGGTPAFQPYYKLVLKWLRRVTPRPPWRLPPSWRPAAVPAGGCLASCYTAHAFLQAVGGVLFPLGLLWLWEERLRARELRSWRRALAQQEQQRQQHVQQQQQQQQQQDREPDTLEASGGIPGSSQQQQLRRRRRQQGSPSPQGSPPPQGSPIPQISPTLQGSPATQGSPAWREGSPPLLPQDAPLPFAPTALWFVLSSWLVWLLLEALLL